MAVQYCYRIIKAAAAHLRGQKRIGTVLFVFMRVVELFMKPDSLNLLPTQINDDYPSRAETWETCKVVRPALGPATLTSARAFKFLETL